MKKTVLKLKVILSLCICGSLTFTAGQSSAKPVVQSFGFVQETSTVLKEGLVLVDLYNSIGYRNTIRIGAFGGEVMVDTTSGNNARGIGYKRAINEDVTAYGMLFIDNDASFTNLTAGIAYTTFKSGWILNVNAEIFNQSDPTGAAGVSETFMDVRGSAFYPLTGKLTRGKVSIGIEVDLEISPDSVTDVYFGARWVPKRNIVIDLGLYESFGAPSPAPSVSTVSTPAFLRLNVTF